MIKPIIICVKIGNFADDTTRNKFIATFSDEIGYCIELVKADLDEDWEKYESYEIVNLTAKDIFCSNENDFNTIQKTFNIK